MAVKMTLVSGIFNSAEQAKQAAADFKAAGFSREAVTEGVKLTVHCDSSDEITRAKQILEKTGAHDISSEEETREIFVES